jgi:hypothetical protein
VAYVCCAKYFAKLDGQDYPVKGSTAYNQVSLQKTDANTIDGVRKMNGKETGTVRYQVSDGDPNQLTMTIKPTVGELQVQFFNRQSKLIDPINRVIGDWLRDESKILEPALRGLPMKFTDEGSNAVRFDSAFSYTATLDGKESASLRNSTADSVCVQVLEASTVQETYKLKGKVIGTGHFIVSDGGRTLTVDAEEISGALRTKTKLTFRKE